VNKDVYIYRYIQSDRQTDTAEIIYRKQSPIPVLTGPGVGFVDMRNAVTA